MQDQRLAIIEAWLPVERWADLLDGTPSLAYLGQDLANHRQVLRAAGCRATPLSLGQSLNRYAEEVREEFINLDQAVANPAHDLLWQASDLAERNPYTCGLFHDCCALLAGMELLARHKGSLLLFVENPELRQMLARQGQALGWTVLRRTAQPLLDRWPGLGLSLHRARMLGQALRSRCAFLRDLAAKRAILRSAPRRLLPQEQAALVCLWADGKTFPVGGPKRRDPFWAQLPGHWRDKGLQVIYLALPMDWTCPYPDIVRNLAASPEFIATPEEAQTLAQAAWDALRTMLWRPRRTGRFALAGQDMEPLFRDALRQERQKTRQCFALRFLRLGAFLRRKGVRLHTALHLYENQPWEKMLRLGLGQAFPEARLRAYQHVPFSRFYLSFLPSRQDIAAGLVPDVLLTPGTSWCRVFTQAGLPAPRVALAPAVRLGHLYDTAFGAQPPGDKAPGLDALVVGGLDYAELQATLRMVCSLSPPPVQVRFWLKLHPTMCAEDRGRILREFTAADSTRILVTEQPIAECLEWIDVVLYSMSGVCYEALGRGKAALFIGAEIRLDMNKLDWLPDHGLTARTAGQLTSRLTELARLSPQEHKERGLASQRVLADMFEPVSPAGLDCFLPATKPTDTRPMGSASAQPRNQKVP